MAAQPKSGRVVSTHPPGPLISTQLNPGGQERASEGTRDEGCHVRNRRRALCWHGAFESRRVLGASKRGRRVSQQLAVGRAQGVGGKRQTGTSCASHGGTGQAMQSDCGLSMRDDGWGEASHAHAHSCRRRGSPIVGPGYHTGCMYRTCYCRCCCRRRRRCKTHLDCGARHSRTWAGARGKAKKNLRQRDESLAR
jgi:hypothetical protein